MTVDQGDPARADRRRDWALQLLAGGGMAMTAFAAATLYLVRDKATYAFWLGMAAMGLIGVVLTGFAGLIVRRTVKISRDGIEVADQAPPAGEQ